jgi:hypothetical protein
LRTFGHFISRCNNKGSFHLSAKGHLISEQIYAVIIFSKMQQDIARISALASKMGQIKKVKAHHLPKLVIIYNLV